MTIGARRASFHDPDGSVFIDEDVVWRVLTREAGERVMRFLATSVALDLLARADIPATDAIEASQLAFKFDAGSGQQWFRHARLPFLNYPHEWLPEQLVEASLATLRLARLLREQGWDIKDGNARNVMFDGLRPVFVDFGSFVERGDHSPIWRPAGQIQRHFLLPLLAYLHLGLSPSQMLLGRPDGVSHEEAFACLRSKRWTDSHVFWMCVVPVWLSSPRMTFGPLRAGLGLDNPQLCRVAVDRTVDSLYSRARSLAGRLSAPKSQWAGYQSTRSHYAEAQLTLKREAVSRMLQRTAPRQLLDVGTNGGEFANLAARLGAKVVSIDLDLDALRLARQSAQEHSLDILHLHVDFTSPTPAIGWGGAECLSFDERARGSFDLVMALAVIHHLLVAGRIPLEEIIQRLAQYTRDYLIIEYVDTSDEMFTALCRDRDSDFSWFDRNSFESVISLNFTVVDRVEIIPDRRALYLCQRLKS